MAAAAASRQPRRRLPQGAQAAVVFAGMVALALAINASMRHRMGLSLEAAGYVPRRLAVELERVTITTSEQPEQNALPDELGGGDTAAQAESGPGAKQPAVAAVRTTPAAPDEFECKRMLWMAGLQAKAADGSEAHYITSSASYLRYYASALRSAREHAPSLLPVLVVLNSMPQEFVDWVEAQGALVVRHELSFASRMEAISDPWLRDNLTKQLMASYARLDVPAIMEKVALALPEYEQRWQKLDDGAAALAAPKNVDLETVMWTDPDVLFRRDIDSCSLPKPRLLSIGPELRPGTVINCGVMLFNVKAYAATLPAILDFADSRKWSLVHDQDLVEQFFKANNAASFRKQWHRLTALPDAYNYKAYWGEPEAGWMSMFTHQVGDVVIVHTHGPKPELSLCVIEYLQRNVKKRVGWEPKHVLHRKNDIVQECGVQVAMYLDELLQIMAGAFKADEGAMYRWVLREQNRLCPGACWLADNEEAEADPTGT